MQAARLRNDTSETQPMRKIIVMSATMAGMLILPVPADAQASSRTGSRPVVRIEPSTSTGRVVEHDGQATRQRAGTRQARGRIVRRDGQATREPAGGRIGLRP